MENSDEQKKEEKIKVCRRCKATSPASKFSMHLIQCQVQPFRPTFRDKAKFESANLVVCGNCGEKIKKEEFDSHRMFCIFEEACQYCKSLYPEERLYNHEIMCRKNPVAKAIRKQNPNSSDQPDSSDEEEEWEMDEDYYYHKKQKKEEEKPRVRQRSSSSEGEQDNRIVNMGRQREGPFRHRPRREYRLSQSSSSQDQGQRFWRTYHESFSTIPTQFYVRSYTTDLEGITVVVSSEGPGGRVIRRTVHNDLTGTTRNISNHRFQRHYRTHVIEPEQPLQIEINGAVMRISNRQMSADVINQILNEYSEADTGLTQSQLHHLSRDKYKPQPEQQRCVICYLDYAKDQPIITLNCKHFFHQSCIVQWLVQNSKCPLCKAKQN